MKTKNIMFIIVGVLLVVGMYFGFDNMSIIVGEESETSCRINTTTNECVFNITLPRFRELDEYNFDLSFEDVPGELQDLRVLTPIHSQGTYRDERKRDGVLYRLNNYDYYLYRLPNEWDRDKIFSIYVKGETEGTFRRTITTRVTHRTEFGFVNLNYSNNNLETCGDVRTIDRSPTCVVENFRYSDGEREWRTVDYNLNMFSNLHRDFRITTETTLRETYPFISKFENHILLDDVAHIDDLLFIGRIRQELWGDRNTGDIPTMTAQKPVFEIAYTERVRVSDLKIMIGDNVVQEVSGVMKDTLTSKDMSSYINDYCNRESSTTTCVVPVTFKSSTDGLVTLKVEEGVLIAQPYEVKTDYATIQDNDFNNNIIIYVALGIIVLVLLILLYFKFWRK